MDSTKRKQIIRKNFLESLRELGTSVNRSAREDLISGTAKTAMKQVFGQTGSHYSETGPSKFPSPEIKEKFRWSGQEFTDIKIQERVVFKKAEQEVKIKIESLRQELTQLVQVTQKLSKEVKIAAIQSPAEPSLYQLSYMERLREFIIFMRKNIADSCHWLSMQNQRSKKRNYYWGQVKKSGTKFMLSSERQVSTQTG